MNNWTLNVALLVMSYESFWIYLRFLPWQSYTHTACMCALRFHPMMPTRYHWNSCVTLAVLDVALGDTADVLLKDKHALQGADLGRNPARFKGRVGHLVVAPQK